MKPPGYQPLDRRRFLGRIAASIPLLGGLPLLQGATPPTHAPHPYHRNTRPEPPPPEELARWQRAIRIPVQEHETGGLTPLFLEAIRRGEVLYGSYGRYGGGNDIRRITPLALFRVAPPRNEPPPDRQEPETAGLVYLQAWDHDRQAQRTFQAHHFSPFTTAPWMRPHVFEGTEAEWHTQLDRTARALAEEGVTPVGNGH